MHLTPKKPWTSRLTAAACAVAVAAIVVSPTLRFRADAGSAAQGIEFIQSKDAEWYVAHIRHVLDGTHGAVNDWLFEGSQGERHAPAWPYWLLARLHEATGAGIHPLMVGTMAVCAALQFLLLRAAARAAGLGRPASTAAALAGCLAPYVWSFHGFQLWLGRPELPSTGFLPLFRPFNPSVTSLPVWAALVALLRWSGTRSARWWWVAAAALAVQWNAYPPSFLMTGALVAGFAAVALLRREFRAAALTLGIAAAAGAVNVPAVLATTRRFGQAALGGMQANLLALPTRTPILSADTLTACALAAVWLALRAGRRPSPVRAALVVGAPVALLLVHNQQVLTGRLDQPFHYDWFWAVPLIWLSAAAVLTELRGRLRGVARRLGRPAVRRAVIAIGTGVPACVAVLAFAGAPGAAILRAAGIVRGESVARPLLLAGCAAVAVAAVWGAVSALRRHRWSRLGAAAAGIAGLAAAAEGWRIQDLEYVRRRDGVLAMQPAAGALRFLREHGTADDVVACSDDGLARLVPSYTGRNVLISAEVQFAPMPPDEEFRRRRYVAFALFGLPPDAFEAGLGDGRAWHASVFKWRTVGPPPRAVAAISSGLHLVPLEPSAIPQAAREYREMAARRRHDLLREFRLDWVVWRAAGASPGFRDPGEGDGLRLAWEGGGVRVYRVE